VPKSGPLGSVRGACSNARPYRDFKNCRPERCHRAPKLLRSRALPAYGTNIHKSFRRLIPCVFPPNNQRFPEESVHDIAHGDCRNIAGRGGALSTIEPTALAVFEPLTQVHKPPLYIHKSLLNVPNSQNLPEASTHEDSPAQQMLEPPAAPGVLLGAATPRVP